MRDTYRKFAVFAIAAFALLAGRLVAWADDPVLSKLLSGPPAHLGQALPKESYVKFEVRKLKRAKILWRNTDALAKKGVHVPSFDNARALAAFDAEVLSHVGYAVFKEGMKEADFESETREMMADRYGGTGIGVNNGSGRAGSTGGVQIKGIGQTPLVGDVSGDSHSHGGMNFREGQADIIMGEMFHRELPYGANRVLFAIDTGLNLPGEGRRIMIVREDPVRPAHFVKVFFGQGESAGGDAARLRAAGPYLIKALPAVQGEAGKSQTEVLTMRLESYVDRAAEQYAAAIAKKLFHGATSPSNFLLDGRFIDFSTSSALLGYGPVKTLDHVEAFGELDEIVKDLVKTLIVAANEHAKVSDAPRRNKKRKWITDQRGVQLFAYQFETRFQKAFDAAMNRQFLLLAGFSEEVVAKLSASPAGQALGLKLREVAFEPAEWMKGEPVSLKSGVPNVSTSRYDAAAVYEALAESRVDPAARERLASALPDERLRESLSNAYERFFEAMLKQTSAAAERELVTEMVSQVQARNRTLYSFFRSRIMGDANNRTTSYQRWGNALSFQKGIDAAVSSEGTRPPTFRLPERCELALMEFKAGWLKQWLARAQAFFKPLHP